ncbi:MAG: glycine betaine ABC transporter substrate-binding protein [Cyclobacteriaceae bacterium]
MRMTTTIFLLLLALNVSGQKIVVGAKHFNEGYILGEMIAVLLEQEGFEVERKFNLGGTAVIYEALKSRSIDIYPEYTGTLAEEVLKSKTRLDYNALKERLLTDLQLEISGSYGFNNTYALATTGAKASELNLKSISDLRDHPDLTAALSYEFLKRQDGWDNLKSAYGLSISPVGIEHGLAYQAITSDKVELTDVYSTDGEIKKYGLVLLEDDLDYFPKYNPVSVYHTDLDPGVKAIVSKLTGKISEEEMQTMNASVLFEEKSFNEVVNEFLLSERLIGNTQVMNQTSYWGEILEKTIAHLGITAVSLGLAILVAVPLGILLYLFSSISRPVLYFVGLLQTIPSIALLALMIPLIGIGRMPAIVALFLYALLPILRNTTTGLTSVDPVLRKVARGMGMTAIQRLRYVEFPLAMPSILGGIRTAAVITIGTATLAAFIGAGGLGEFIVTGLALNNTQLILQGAIPAAVLAIMVEFVFELLEKALIPKHLRT